MPYKFSPSRLSLINDCPRCFWLHFNKGIKRPEGIFPSLPNGMDKILKAHFDAFRDKDQLPPELKELDDVKLYDNIFLLEAWRNYRQGIKWEDEHGNIFMGAVDNILKKGDKLIVLDYKTRGYALKDDTAEHYRLQQNVYNFLLRKNGYETEDYFFLLFYVPNKVTKTGEVIFDTTLVKMDVDVKMAEKTWKKTLKLLDGDCPSKYCGGCERR